MAAKKKSASVKREMSHTPGPWWVSCESSNQAEAECIEANGKLIAWTANTWDADADDGLGAEVITDEDRANGQLIAAAPELLAALKLLRDPDGVGRWPCYCNEPHFDGGKCENCIATAAIDKAEGRSE